jgi:hypothetical protein
MDVFGATEKLPSVLTLIIDTGYVSCYNSELTWFCVVLVFGS